MTDLMRQVFKRVYRATYAGGWFRAEHPGQRVTLAALCRAGWLERQAWRGKEGDADAAHEYRVPTRLVVEIGVPSPEPMPVPRGRPHENDEERAGRERAEEDRFDYLKDEGLLRRR